jgi:hypothetical protein
MASLSRRFSSRSCWASASVAPAFSVCCLAVAWASRRPLSWKRPHRDARAASLRTGRSDSAIRLRPSGPLLEAPVYFSLMKTEKGLGSG